MAEAVGFWRSRVTERACAVVAGFRFRKREEGGCVKYSPFRYTWTEETPCDGTIGIPAISSGRRATRHEGVRFAYNRSLLCYLEDLIVWADTLANLNPDQLVRFGSLERLMLELD